MTTTTTHRTARRLGRLSPVLVAAVLLAGACGSSDGDAAGEDDATTTAATGELPTTTAVKGIAGDTEVEEVDHLEGPHFAYTGEAGPERWGELDEAWSTCGTGTAQSPVDLAGAAAASDEDLPDLEFDYSPSGLSLLNNGHTVQAVYDAGSTLTVGGTEYVLDQLHLHAHSEHTVDGRTSPLEVHLVHRAGTELAVVGVLIEEGAENPAYAELLQSLSPEVATKPVPVPGTTIDAAALLPEDRTFFHYEGSLTTPPCSEGVSWQVLTTPVELSAEQIARFTAIYDDDARPVQELGDRSLTVSGP